MISIKNITKKFPSVTALDNVTLEIKEREFFGLLGPNGAGKSTLINLLAGYLDSVSGELLILIHSFNSVFININELIFFIHIKNILPNF